MKRQVFVIETHELKPLITHIDRKIEFVLGNVGRREESFIGRKNFFDENEIEECAGVGGTLDEKGDNLNAIILAITLGFG